MPRDPEDAIRDEFARDSADPYDDVEEDDDDDEYGDEDEDDLELPF